MHYQVFLQTCVCVWEKGVKWYKLWRCDLSMCVRERLCLQWHDSVCVREGKAVKDKVINHNVRTCVSSHFSPVLIASGLMLTSKQMDWPGPRLPDDWDTVHSSPSLLSSVSAAIALQSNHQLTCSLTPLRQNTLSSHAAFSSTVCRGRAERETEWDYKNRQQEPRR